MVTKMFWQYLSKKSNSNVELFTFVLTLLSNGITEKHNSNILQILSFISVFDFTVSGVSSLRTGFPSYSQTMKGKVDALDLGVLSYLPFLDPMFYQ